MHDVLFRHQKALENADLERRVETDGSSALASGATGTPAIFVDGLPYLGSYEWAELRRALSPNGEETE
jgi:protein-disulfide isomerase